MKQADLVRKDLASVVLLTLLALAGFAARRGYSQQAPATPPGAASQPSQPAAAPADPAKVSPVPPDKVVVKVGDRQVTAADVDFLIHTLSPQDQQSIATQGKGALGNQYIQMLLLEQQALRDHLDTTPDFRREEQFERARRLATAEYQKMAAEMKVSPEEISQYYAAHPSDFDKVEVRQVGIRVKPAGAKADTPGLSLEEAKARAEEIRKALGDPGADPQKVAKQFAVPNVVFIDPQNRTVERTQLPPDLADAIFKLKDGEISATKETPQSVFFVQVAKHVHPEVKDVSSSIEGLLRQEKLTSALTEMKSKTTVWSDEEFFKAPPAAKAATGAPASPVSTVKESSDKRASDKQIPEKQPPK